VSDCLTFLVLAEENAAGLAVQRDVERLGRHRRDGGGGGGRDVARTGRTASAARSAGAVLEETERVGETDRAEVFHAVPDHVRADIAQR